MSDALAAAIEAMSDEELAAFERELREEELLERVTGATGWQDADAFKAYLQYVFAEVWRGTAGTDEYLPAHVGEWADELCAGGDVAINAPPEHAKSVTLRGYMLWRIGHDHNIRIGLLMRETESQAWAQVRAMRDIIEGDNEQSARYRSLFPEVRPDRTAGWKQGEITVVRDMAYPDPTIFGAGVDKSFQGKRWDLLIMDDIIGQQDVRSPATMRHVEELVRGTASGRMVAGGQMVALYTRWGPNDMNDTYESMGFRMVNMPAIGYWDRSVDPETGKTIWGEAALWPDYWPAEPPDAEVEPERAKRLKKHSLAEKRTGMGSPMFTMSFLGRADAIEGGSFKRSWFRYFDWLNPEKTIIQRYGPDGTPIGEAVHITARSAGVDPAASVKKPGKKDPDDTAWMRAVRDAEHNIYFYDDRRTQTENGHREWLLYHPSGPQLGLEGAEKPGWIGFEAIGLGKVIFTMLRDSTDLPLRMVTGNTRKEVRKEPLIERYRLGKVYHHISQKDQEFEKQLLAFGSGAEKDDLVDAAELAAGLGLPGAKVTVRGQRHNPFYPGR